MLMFIISSCRIVAFSRLELDDNIVKLCNKIINQAFYICCIQKNTTLIILLISTSKFHVKFDALLAFSLQLFLNYQFLSENCFKVKKITVVYCISLHMSVLNVCR